MQVSIYSRQAIETLIKGDFPKNSAVISFLDPPDNYHNKNSAPVDYKNKAERIFYVAVHDIDLSVLPKFNLSYETYFPEADHLAEFIFKAKNDGLDIICQCEYGESRSSGCAAAILEYFYKTGISVSQTTDIIQIRLSITKSLMLYPTIKQNECPEKLTCPTFSQLND